MGGDFCFVVDLGEVLCWLAEVEVLEVDFAEVDSSFGVATSSGCFLAWRCVVVLVVDLRSWGVRAEDLRFAFDSGAEAVLRAGVSGSDVSDVWNSISTVTTPFVCAVTIATTISFCRSCCSNSVSRLGSPICLDSRGI